MPRCRGGEGGISGDQVHPLGQGRRQIEAVVGRLIEIEGDRVGRRDVVGGGQQPDRRRLDRR